MNLPEMHVCIQRNRLKLYDALNYYLEDGQNFQIELYNPLPTSVGAKLSINGQYLAGQRLVVVRPGERVYLERFIDVDARFLFSAYTVDSTPQTGQAIANNGNLRVDFFHEIWTSMHPHSGTITLSDNNVFRNNDTFRSSPSKFSYSTNTSTIGTTANAIGNEDNVYHINSVIDQTQTGRIEKGDPSDQHIKMSAQKFATQSFLMVSRKLLPKTLKPVTYQELRRYCTQCGTKAAKEDKFCSQCGHRL